MVARCLFRKFENLELWKFLNFGKPFSEFFLFKTNPSKRTHVHASRHLLRLPNLRNVLLFQYIKQRIRLLRALEPLKGLDTMKQFRNIKHDIQKHNPHFLCNAPSKLCIAMDVRKDNCNKLDLCDNEMLWIEDDPEFNLEEYKVVKTARIGIDRVDPEWALKPLRFYLLGHPCVSKRNKQAEKELINS